MTIAHSRFRSAIDLLQCRARHLRSYGEWARREAGQAPSCRVHHGDDALPPLEAAMPTPLVIVSTSSQGLSDTAIMLALEGYPRHELLPLLTPPGDWERSAVGFTLPEDDPLWEVKKVLPPWCPPVHILPKPRGTRALDREAGRVAAAYVKALWVACTA